METAFIPPDSGPTIREDRLFDALDVAPVGLAKASLDGRLLRVNASMCHMLGRTAEALKGMSFLDLTHPNDRAHNLDALRRLQAGETEGLRLEKRYLRPDGGVVRVELAVVVVPADGGGERHYLAVVQDVSAHHAAQASLEQREREFKGLLAAIPDIIARFDPQLRHTYVNPAITAVTGLPPEHFVGRSHRELRFPEEMCATWERLLAQGFAGGEPFAVEWEWTDPAGKLIRYYSRVFPERDAEGRVASLLAMSRDVTDAGRLERARTAEGRYQALVEATSAAVWRAGPDGLFHGPQPSWEALTGQTTGEVQGIGWLAAVHPDDRRHTLAEWTRAVAERTPYEVEHRVRTAAGEWRPMHARAAPVAAPDGTALEWVGAETDISGRRRAEQTVRFQASLLEAVDHAVIATDLSGRVTYWNPPAERLLGWTAEEVHGRGLEAVLAGAVWPGDPMELLRRLQSGGGWSGEVELRRRDGTAFHGLLSAAPVRNEAGGLTGVVRVLADVSGLKQAEAAARESEARFRSLSMTSPDFVAVLDVPGGTVSFANRDALLGWPVQGDHALRQLTDAIHPDDLKAVRGAWRVAVEQGGVVTLEHRMHRPDGSVEWLESRQTVLSRGGDGTPREMLCQVRVVTARRQADEALRRSEEHLRGVLDHVACAVGVLQPDGRLIYANRTSLQATGSPAREALGRRFDQAPPWSHSAAAQARVREALDRAAAGETVRYDETARLAGGELTTVDLQIAPMRDGDGRVEHLIPTAIDVGARVRARVKVAEQESRLRMALRATGAVMWERDAASGVVQWDASLGEHFGYAGTGQTELAWWWDRVHPDDRPATDAALRAAREGRAEEFSVTYRFRHADGSWIPVRDRGCPVADDRGAMTRMVGVMVDLSPQGPLAFPLPRLETEAAG